MEDEEEDQARPAGPEGEVSRRPGSGHGSGVPTTGASRLPSPSPPLFTARPRSAGPAACREWAGHTQGRPLTRPVCYDLCYLRGPVRSVDDDVELLVAWFPKNTLH